MASVLLTIFVSLFLVIIVSDQFDFVISSPLPGNRNVVYTRYVRRRPFDNSDNYVREIVEVFKTNRRPPPFAFLHDEDLTRFVRCDFDPSFPDCDDDTYSGIITPAFDVSTLKTTIPIPTPTPTSFMSTWDPKTKIQTTTSTTQYPSILLDEETSSTTSASPIVSEEHEDRDEDAGNEYDEDKLQESKPNTAVQDPNETEYYEENDNNNSEDTLESNGETDTTADDDIEIQTTPEITTIKPTKKSFFSW